MSLKYLQYILKCERTCDCVCLQEFTQLDEEDHGHGGSEVTHALAEVVTTIGHVSEQHSSKIISCSCAAVNFGPLEHKSF